MLLKKIIISGFKSFAERVSLDFDRGITGVVGPNGSGKSNIIDAVRWVMGEQNAKNLRGEKATDIIFAGSDKRKALGMAEVSVIFDNSEASPFCPPEYRHETEITLTRRIYIDGQREYLINKRACRFKDMVEFFATTGLGGRSYSIIQQGQVERVLNAKPEDIREIIEEAAGTLIFKRRKAEAEKKLEFTQSNLSRVDDIVIEISRQIEALSTQVEKARKWRELSDELKTKELAVFSHNYKLFSEQKTKIEKDVNEESVREVETLTALSHFESRHQELQAILDESDPEMQRIQEHISVTREKIAGLQSGHQGAAVKIESGRKRLQEISDEVSRDDLRLRTAEETQTQKASELERAQAEERSLRDLVESFDDRVENSDETLSVMRSRIEEAEEDLRNLDRLLDSNKIRSESLARDMAKVARERVEVSERVTKLDEEFAQTLIEVESARARVTESKKGLDTDIADKHQRESALAKRYDQIKILSKQRDEEKEKYLELRARHTTLSEAGQTASDLSENLSILYEKQPDAKNLIAGLFTDFVTYTQEADELPKAAMSSFERWSERLVVESIHQFNQLVRAANQYKLNSFSVHLLEGQLATDRSSLERWASTIDAEPFTRYLRVTKNLPALDAFINRIYFLPALGIDSETLKSVPADVILFTAQGVVIQGKDDLIVGAKELDGMLSRKTAAERIGIELKDLERSLAFVQSEIDKQDSLQNEDRVVIAEIDERLQKQNSDVLDLMAILQAEQQTADHKQERLKELHQRLNSMVEEEGKFGDELKKLNSAFDALTEERMHAQIALAGFRGEFQEINSQREEIQSQVQNSRLSLAKAEERLSSLSESLRVARATLEELQSALTRRYSERQRVESEVATAQQMMGELERQIEDLILQRSTLEDEMAERREKNSGIVEELRVIEGKIHECRDQAAKRQRLISDRGMTLERLKAAIEGIIAQAEEKYQIQIESYSAEADSNFDADQQGKEVQRIRARLEAMGPINMMAIQEYDELVKRHDFIMGQKDEITASIELLTNAILEIEETSTTKFIDTFSTINREFGEIFQFFSPAGRQN